MKATDLPETFPRIETSEQAAALGPILAEVLHYDAAWASKVFAGNQLTYGLSGPEALNNELQSCWNNYWGLDEKRRIFVSYVAARIER